MKAKVIACANMKGGVGKSTVALSLAEGTSYLGAGKMRVLVLDLDLQMNASTTLVADSEGAEPWYHKKTIEDYLRAKHNNARIPAMSLIHEIDDSLHLLSGKLTLVNFERQLLGQRGPMTHVRNDVSSWLKELLLELEPNFDLIVVDTPPGLSILAECAMQLSDFVVIPTVPNRLSAEGLSTFAKYITDELKLTDVGAKSAVLINMQPGTVSKNGEEWVKQIKEEAGQPSFPYRLFDTPYSLANAFRTATDIDRPGSFQKIWGTAGDQVLVATRQLWSFIGAPLHGRV
jgi:cellulose biosynthesis protein BcsQ